MTDEGVSDDADKATLVLLKAVDVVTAAAGVVMAMLDDDDAGVSEGLALVEQMGGSAVIAGALMVLEGITSQAPDDDAS